MARRYWRSDRPYDYSFDTSLENQRLQDLWEQELRKLEEWWAFLDSLRKELPGLTIGDATATPDACFRCAAYSPRTSEPERPTRFIVVGCVSILAPVYTLYGVEYASSDIKRRKTRVYFEPLPSDMRQTAEVIARRIEATFTVTALPREIAETPIPLFVEPLKPPQTTLFHAFFTSEPDRLP
ncbi:hypothetical protein [Hyalangium rubrum]|uniref:Uncharacterized protein n=1 Tax=Hyalangium rubrum TaxID=3103134 RepID=A0ABU5HDX8_9BACT|nr:hypothetical protein [Hyalangium sp. s54d21]MDY7231480.1 hypothetical protein [Hyalangium sp. s54d21]